MNFKVIFLTICFLMTTSLAAYSAEDAFAKRLKICNPYKTTFKDNKGASLQKGVLGVYIDNMAGQSCVYYIQQNTADYMLCFISTANLSKDKSVEEFSKCAMTDKDGIEQARKDILTNVFLFHRYIIRRNGMDYYR